MYLDEQYTMRKILRNRYSMVRTPSCNSMTYLITCVYLDVWYSAVIRSSYSHGNVAPDLSREVLDWTAFCLWSTYDLVTADETILVWRYPIALKHKFYSTFQKYAGEELQTHPMLAHAYFTEQILSHTYTFLEHFSEPLYSWVCHCSKNPN